MAWTVAPYKCLTLMLLVFMVLPSTFSTVCPTTAWKQFSGSCYLFKDQLTTLNAATDLCGSSYYADLVVVCPPYLYYSTSLTSSPSFPALFSLPPSYLISPLTSAPYSSSHLIPLSLPLPPLSSLEVLILFNLSLLSLTCPLSYLCFLFPLLPLSVMSNVHICVPVSHSVVQFNH